MLFERRLPPDWDAIKAIWDDCHDFLLQQGLPTDPAYALSMSTQELLENAVKYGVFDPGEQIGLVIEVQTHSVIIEVRSRVDPDPARLRSLDDSIQWIRGFQNPFEAFVERLKRVSSQSQSSSESGLGLTRIAFEGQCILDFYVDANDILSISAVYQPPKPLPEPRHANSDTHRQGSFH